MSFLKKNKKEKRREEKERKEKRTNAWICAVALQVKPSPLEPVQIPAVPFLIQHLVNVPGTAVAQVLGPLHHVRDSMKLLIPDSWLQTGPA